MSNLALIYPDAEREPSASAGFDFSSAFITRASDALIAKFDYAKEVPLFVRFQWSVLVPHSLGLPFAKMLIVRCRCNIDEILVRNHNLPRNVTRPILARSLSDFFERDKAGRLAAVKDDKIPSPRSKCSSFCSVSPSGNERRLSKDIIRADSHVF